MFRVSHPPWPAIVALVLILGACERSATRHPERRGDPETRPERGPTPEAKASFAAVAKRYAAAKAAGKLSKAQCDALAKDFLGVFDEHGPTMAMAKFDAGAVREECGQPREAETIYEELTREAPKFALAYNNLGVIRWNRGQEAKALDLFKRAVQVDSATTAPRNNLAAALRQRYTGGPEQQLFVAAENEIQSVLALDSNNRLAYENLARLYYDRGRLEDKSYLLLADLVITQALAKVKAGTLVQSADIYNIKGLLFMEQDNQVDALKAFKKAVEIQPRHADAHMNIALVAIRFRDYATAEKSLEVALGDRRQKRNVEAYLGLGVAQRGLRKYGAAESSFKKAMDVGGSDPRPLYNLGILYHEHIGPEVERKNKTDDFDERPYRTAKQYFEKFLGQASGNAKLATHATDAKLRVTNIENYFEDIKQMKELEKQARDMLEQQRKQEEAEKDRLRKLEDKLKAGS
jgi:tetratricopeptide (TPR) repeat protein